MVAKNEDEYVQLALQLASDLTALSKLRLSLRDLMLKSPLCDGPKFGQNLEEIYRSIWRRYCKGDVPSLKHLEMLQQQQQQEKKTVSEGTVDLPENNRSTADSKGGLLGSIKANGFSLSSSTLNRLSTEENKSSFKSDVDS